MGERKTWSELPVRVYCQGDKKMVSVRLPERLWAELERIAKAEGWTTTDVVTTALDQYAQWKNSEGKPGKRSKPSR